jgi:predicted dinucleotide-binding enzyme
MKGVLCVNVSVLGAGGVGGSLAIALAEAGHQVTLGVRDESSPKAQAAGKQAADHGAQMQIASIEDAVAASEVIALTVSWPGAADVLTRIPDWGGKVLIDVTNRFSPPTEGSAPTVGEEVARLANGARVVKALNTIGAEHYLDPVFRMEHASMLICGDDMDAKQIVADLLTDMGFEPVDAGPLANVGMVESLARLWVTLVRGGMGRNFAFRLIRK